MPPADIQAFQLEKLRETVAFVQQRVPFYQRKLNEAGVTAEGIRSLDDLSKIPFTVKNDLRDHYPFGLFAVPMQEVVRLHASSGTTGKPITKPYTLGDLDLWAECMARSLWSAGVRPTDILQDAHGYGLFTGGLGFLGGATRIGCGVVPTSSGQTERQVLIIQDFGTTVLCCTPSYMLTIAEKAGDMRVDIRSSPLRLGVFGAEPSTVAMREEIEQRLGITAHETYGLTEVGGPGTAFGCEVQEGLHINEDHFLAEVVDPSTLEPLPLGETGELIFTTLQQKALPLIRYRTRDITRLRREPCACGRTTVKMDKVSGRTDDMLIISGVNVFPSQIESLLLDIEEVEPQYVLVIRKKGYLDQLTIQVEGKQEVYDAGPRKREEVEGKIATHIRGIVGISVRVDLLAPKSLARSEGKAKRVIDERSRA
jgi:phenylacetate-CoA ligase